MRANAQIAGYVQTTCMRTNAQIAGYVQIHVLYANTKSDLAITVDSVAPYYSVNMLHQSYGDPKFILSFHLER